jgi:hypothetical protein
MENVVPADGPQDARSRVSVTFRRDKLAEVIMDSAPKVEPHVLHVLEPGEELKIQARATEAILAVTDRRLVVTAAERVALAIGFEDLRRIQFDIERDRPATLVIVPEMAHHEPQVLSIPPDRYRETADALVLIGQRLAASGERSQAS